MDDAVLLWVDVHDEAYKQAGRIREKYSEKKIQENQ